MEPDGHESGNRIPLKRHSCRGGFWITQTPKEHARGDMDTVEFGFDSFDLSLKVRSAIAKNNKDSMKPRTKRLRGQNNYAHFISAKIDSKRIALYWRPSFSTCAKFKVQVHLSDFDTLDDFWTWWREIVCGSFDESLRSKVMRLDCCVDVAVPLQSIRETVSRKRIRTWKVYSNGRGETMEMGSSSSDEYLVAYEKDDLNRDALDYLPEDATANAAGYKTVRLEVRFKDKKLPIRFLSELESIKHLYPFDKYQVHRNLDALDPNMPHKIQVEALAFKQLCATKNTVAAKKFLNEHRNWNRQLGRHLIRIENDFIKQAWRRRVHRFFGERKSSSELIGVTTYREALYRQRNSGPS